jgi:hypothetical protein
MTISFKEWQAANLTAEQQQECADAGAREGNRALAAGATDISAGFKFPTPEQLSAFLVNKDPVLAKYWDQYVASTK